jgi:hypothetical protein
MVNYSVQRSENSFLPDQHFGHKTVTFVLICFASIFISETTRGMDVSRQMCRGEFDKSL